MKRFNEFFDVVLETPVVVRLKPVAGSELDHAFWDFEQLYDQVSLMFISTIPSEIDNGEILIVPYNSFVRINREMLFGELYSLAVNAIQNAKERGEFDFIEDFISAK